MKSSRRFIIAIFSVLIITSAVSAEMMSTPMLDNAHQQTAKVSEQTILQSNFSDTSFNSGLSDTDLWSFKITQEQDVTQSSQTQPQLVLENEQDSLSLCLSALMGLCLYSSLNYVRKLHFGFIPEWYHDGGPSQIGHSHVVMPHTLCPELVCCFIQPAWTTEPLIPQYFQRVIVSLWRKSQFTPDVIASRGPPLS